MATLASHQHGKSRVRVARVWRMANGTQVFAEFGVDTVLHSAMEHAFLEGSSEGMTATDTQKNGVYYVAKQMDKPCSVEELGIAIAKHFVREYPLVSKAVVAVKQLPWKRVQVGSRPHSHGFASFGTEIRTASVSFARSGALEITSGISDLKVLKTTQSGYYGFLRDKFTTLPDTKERIVASSVTCEWRYTKPPRSFDVAFEKVRESLMAQFFGPADKGVYSPSVQYTLYQMGQAVVQNVAEVEWVRLNMPNLHFLPCTPVTSKFEDDVYVATSEPRGTIEAVVARKKSAKL